MPITKTGVERVVGGAPEATTVVPTESRSRAVTPVVPDATPTMPEERLDGEHPRDILIRETTIVTKVVVGTVAEVRPVS